jgi:hypothetical protein
VQRQVLLSTEMTGTKRFDAQVESWEVIFIPRAAQAGDSWTGRGSLPARLAEVR